jgi:hypothetical protein
VGCGCETAVRGGGSPKTGLSTFTLPSESQPANAQRANSHIAVLIFDFGFAIFRFVGIESSSCDQSRRPKI